MNLTTEYLLYTLRVNDSNVVYAKLVNGKLERLNVLSSLNHLASLSVCDLPRLCGICHCVLQTYGECLTRLYNLTVKNHLA